MFDESGFIDTKAHGENFREPFSWLNYCPTTLYKNLVNDTAIILYLIQLPDKRTYVIA